MATRYLLLWLEGPLQSWGADSKFGRRDTLPFPTKSGVLGLLLSALGATGEQRELLGSMSVMRQTVVSYYRASTASGNIHASDREPLLRDFHMVGSGYDDSDPWSTLLIPKKSDGGKAVGGGTKMTFRFYLQDAKFAVAVEVPLDLASSFAQALVDPVYDLYLGRKNCAPTDFVFRGVFTSEVECLVRAGEIATENRLVEDFRVVDGEHEGDSFTLLDVPVAFGTRKEYRDRRVTVLKT